MTQDLRPDILFIGGDLYDGTAVDLDKVIEPFSRISAPYGTYFIAGNHEEFSDKPIPSGRWRAGCGFCTTKG
jgi:predicted MPP superfamily phosphohydrolase